MRAWPTAWARPTKKGPGSEARSDLGTPGARPSSSIEGAVSRDAKLAYTTSARGKKRPYYGLALTPVT